MKEKLVQKIQKILKFLLYKFKDKDIIERYYKIKDLPYLSKDENDKRVLKKVNKLLNHSYKNVPYYREVFEKSGIVKDSCIDLKNIADLKQLPFMTKDIIKQQKEQLYSEDIFHRRSYKNTSGGSTGNPVLFIQDREYKISNQANVILLESWRGTGPYDSRLLLWGAERDTYEGKKPWVSYLKEFILNITVLNTFTMSDKDMKNYIKILNRKKPALIRAYVQSIYEIASFANKNNIKVKPQKAIHSAAGTLYDFMREKIEDVFGCKVFNHYGSREVGPIASECNAHDGLHIMMDHTMLEIVNENGELCQAGEEGEIVVTTLNNYSMPLIRYKIGDIGIMQEYEKCSCGCTYPKLKKVIGRSTDIFKSIDGKKIDGEYFTHLFYFIDGVKTFQVIQEEIDKIIVKIVKSSEIHHADIKEIEKKIKTIMGKKCNVVFEFVEEIPKTKTGKIMYTISKV